MVRVRSLSLLMQLISALSPCAPASDGQTAVACGRVDGTRSILVSTIDGALTALSVGGETLWNVDSVKGPLFSSTFSYSKVSPQLVPGLDRLLYQLDGNSLQQLPVTVDAMMEGDLALEGSVLAGSRERAVQGLDVQSGKVLYMCDTAQCVRYSDAVSADPSTDTFKVTLDRVQVRGASASTGVEQWNFTVGRLLLSTSRDSGDDPVKDDELEFGLRVDAVGGVITALHKHNGAQLWSKQFSSPIVDLWSVGGGRLHRIIPWQGSTPHPVPSTVLLGSYNGQLYVQPVHPAQREKKQTLGVPLLSKEAGAVIFSLQMPQNVGQGACSDLMTDVAVSQLLLPPNSPAGVGGYFCATSPNESQLLAGRALPPSEAKEKGTTGTPWSDGEPHCPADPGIVTRYSLMRKLLTTLTSPVVMAVVILVLAALVVRSRRKRKILEHDILELRQQSSSVTLTPSTPLVDLEAVADELLGRTLRGPYGRVGVVRKSCSKSESSEDSVHPCESESRFCSDFMPSALLGRGAYGVVYHCQNRVDGGDYAVKRIKLPGKEGAREKVMREAKALAQLDHPGIVRYYGAWVEKGCTEDTEWDGHFSADTGREEQSWMSTAGGTRFTHHDSSPSPHMPPAIDTAVPSGSSHSSFTVEFRDSSNSHSQVEGASASASGVEFQITQGSSSIMPSTAMSDSEEAKEGAGRDGGRTGAVLPSAQLFIQMQLCRKDSLRDWLRTSVEARSRRTVLLYFEQTLDAVCYVHHKGMMHRDLKPSNIFFSFDGRIKIGDFGLVAGDFDGFPSSRHTLLDLASLNRKGRTGNVGTRLYISPEQIAGIDYDQKVDIYSLGIIFYEMNHPFPTEMERTKVLEGLHSGHFPVAFKDSLPEELELVRWMLSPDPAHRPSAKQVASSARLAELKSRVKAMLQDRLPRL